MRNSFNLMSAAIFVVVLIAIGGLVVTINQFSVFYAAHNVSNVALENTHHIEVVARSMIAAASVNDEAKTREYLDEAVDTLAEMQEAVAYMREHFTGDDTPIDTYETVMNGGIATRKQIVELAENNKKTEASALYFNEYSAILVSARNALEELSESANDIAESAYERAEFVSLVAAVFLLVVSLIILFAVRIGSSRLVVAIKEPIQELEEAMHELASGNLDFEIAYKSENELGMLADSFRTTCNFLRIVIKDANRLLGLMADGNFDISTEYEDMYVGEFVNLVSSMRTLNRTLNGVLVDIDAVSEQVAVGSEQMASSAQSIAEGASQQAGAVEELQATITNVLGNTKRAAQLAETSYNEARGYADDAQMAEKEMKQMVEAMNEISELSNKIGSIIGNIEDIASQTNLLSLNASIEAARAGEAGRGFAVVAQQIGSLADDSAQYAVDTRELIEHSMEKINMGNEIADKVAQSLKKVVDGMSKIAELSEGSKESSMEQEKEMEQIETGIVHISGIVQTNSVASEQSSAASQELSAHAVQLKNMISRFRFRRS